MTLLVDPKLPEPLEIGAYKYQLKPPTVAERTRWRRAIAAAGGRQHGTIGILDALAKGVLVVMQDSPDDARQGCLNKIYAQKDRVGAFYNMALDLPVTPPADWTEDDKARHQAFVDAGRAMNEGSADLAIIVAEVSAAYPAYCQIVADDAIYWETAGIEAVRMFLVGWEGFDAELTRGAAGVAEESLGLIPEQHLREIGQAFESLAKVGPQQRKNSPSPRPTSSAGETLSI
jgi:hypothetical protein